MGTGATDTPGKPSRLIEPFTVTDGRSFRLKQIDPDDTRGIKSQAHALDLLALGIDNLRTMQEKLYAQGTWAMLLIFQAMDAAGKDSTIKHVMSGINPQGCQVSSFKAPSTEELAHDFLWRTTRRLPERGHIGIFNRSYYEEVLIVRVHPKLLEDERLPRELLSKQIWKQRFEDITAHERYLHRNGVLVRKFFLHVSKEKQRQRFLERLARPDKYWKFSMIDVQERAYWNDYMAAYEDMIRHTATTNAPWYVVPADHKWFTQVVVATAVTDALASLNLSFPKADAARLEEIRIAREMLEREAH